MTLVFEKLSLVFITSGPIKDTHSTLYTVSEHTFITPSVRPNIRTVPVHLVIQELTFINVVFGRDETTGPRSSIIAKVAYILVSVRPTKST